MPACARPRFANVAAGRPAEKTRQDNHSSTLPNFADRWSIRRRSEAQSAAKMGSKCSPWAKWERLGQSLLFFVGDRNCASNRPELDVQTRYDGHPAIRLSHSAWGHLVASHSRSLAS